MKLLLIVTILFHCTLLGAQNITVAEGSFKVAAVEEENFYYGFAAGDQVSIFIREEKSREIKEVEFIEYPKTSRYIEFKKNRIEKTVTIPSTGVYRLRISNGALSSRVCSYRIVRTPATDTLASFSTTVSWDIRHDTTWTEITETYLTRQEYLPVTVVPFTENYVNSESNATFKGGKSRIIIR